MHPWLRFFAQAASCAVLALAAGGAGARTVTLDTASFPDPAVLDGVSLPLNGALHAAGGGDQGAGGVHGIAQHLAGRETGR